MPRFRLVEDLPADERRVGLPHAGRVAGREQVGRSAAAEHRERHPPDVSRGRRVGRVEVPVGVEPGDPKALARPRPAEAAQRARVGRAVTADEQQRRPRIAIERGRDVAGQARQVGGDPLAVLGPWIVVRRPAGVVVRIPGVVPARIRQAGPRGKSVQEAVIAEGARRPLHPAEMATQSGRRAGEHDRSGHRRGAYGAPRRSGMMPGCDSPTSPSSATSPAGSSRSTTCCAPPTSRATR